MSQVLCILASFFDLSAWVRKASTGADQRKPEQCLFLLNFSLLHFPLLYGTGNHIKKKKKEGNINYPSPAGHIPSNLKHRILCPHQAGWSDRQAHSHCRAGTQQVMLGFRHWVPKNTQASCTHKSASSAGQSHWVRQDHSQAENCLYAVVTVK